MLFCARKIQTTNTPKGISAKSCHQPLRLVSCRRLAPTAMIWQKDYQREQNVEPVSNHEGAPLPSNIARKNHQYSLPVARPSVQPTLGYYRGKPEKSIVIEVTGASENAIRALASRIRKMNGQESVLVMRISAKIKSVRN